MQPDSFIVQKSKFGEGLFTVGEVSSGEVIMTLQGEITRKDLEPSDQPDEKFRIQTDVNKFIIPDHPFSLLNHSCEPNCGINHAFELISLRTILKGEELTWDYSTAMFQRDWTMKCLCVTQACRKVITDFDKLPVDVQEKYIKLNIVAPFIADYLMRLSKAASS